MPTDPLTGSRYPVGTDVPDVATYIKNAVIDLSDNTIPDFATTTARDTAYSSWVTLGGTMRNGLRCVVNGVPYRRINGTWRINRNRIIERTATIGGGGAIISGGAVETGVTSGYSLTGGSGNTFTLYEASTVSVMAHFRVNAGAAAAGTGVKIDDTPVGYAGIVRNGDQVTPVIGAVALAAGTHTISLRVEAVGGAVTWVEGRVVVHEGTAE